MLEVGNPNAESVKCFISKKNKLIDSVEFGIHSSNSGRALKTYHGYYDLNISPNDTLELFIRWTDKTPLHLQFSIGTVSKFFESDHLTNFSHGLFYGIIILMIIYNLFLAISGNGREYYFYVFYIFFNLLFLLFFTGHVSVLPQSIRNILYIHPVVIPAIFGTFGILFTMEFLQTKKLMPTIHFFMKLIIGFAAVIVLISLLNYFYIALFLLQIEGILLAAVCLGSGIISFRNKNKFAKFYLFGYGAYLLGLTFFIGSDYDFFPFFNQRIYILESGAIAEAVMLSFAIGEKLNSANRERSEAQQTALEISMENEKIIREQNSMLEQKVLERTQQLQTKNKIIEEKNRDILDSIRYADRKSTRLNSSHIPLSRMPSSA